jgi:hypothetical protein
MKSFVKKDPLRQVTNLRFEPALAMIEAKANPDPGPGLIPVLKASNSSPERAL